MRKGKHCAPTRYEKVSAVIVCAAMDSCPRLLRRARLTREAGGRATERSECPPKGGRSVEKFVRTMRKVTGRDVVELVVICALLGVGSMLTVFC